MYASSVRVSTHGAYYTEKIARFAKNFVLNGVIRNRGCLHIECNASYELRCFNFFDEINVSWISVQLGKWMNILNASLTFRKSDFTQVVYQTKFSFGNTGTNFACSSASKETCHTLSKYFWHLDILHLTVRNANVLRQYATLYMNLCYTHIWKFNPITKIHTKKKIAKKSH